MKRLPVVLISLVFVTACSVEAYRQEADEEVYNILGDKWKPALGEDAEQAGFTIEEPERSLRQQLAERIAQGERPQMELSLAEALEVAAENSREFQDQKERLYLSALSLTGQRNRYSTIFSADNSSSVSGTGNDESQGNSRSSVGASKILASGARVLGGFVNNFFRVFTSGGGWNATSLLSLSITQPLLEGFGSEVTLEPLTQAERSTVYSVRNYERFRRTFCVEVIADYLNVLEQRNNLKNTVANTKSLRENLERSVDLGEAGRLDKFQVDQARQSKLSADDQEINTRARLQSTEDGFKITLGLPMEIDLDLDNAVIEQLKGIGVGEISLTEEEAVRLALTQRLDVVNSAEQVVDAARGVRVAANALKIGLDLTAAIDVPNERTDKAFKMNWHRFDWEVGLQLDLPLDKVNERNVYRQSLIALDAERRAHSLLLDNVTLSIRNALRDVQAAYSAYKIRELSLKLATERVDSTKMLLEAGRVQQRDFLDARDDLLANENSLISALVDYTNSKLRLLRDLEMLDVGNSGLRLDLEALRKWLKEEPKK